MAHEKIKTLEKLKCPIITVAGHVDHGKTSLLDSIRGTSVASKEAGLITQKISFTSLPSSILQERCKKTLDKLKIKIKIPGFLFIDTPGHAAFTNLRKIGGSLADLAILVIDINEGVMEQTRETIEILKSSKVPFVVALNKIDAISGWRQVSQDLQEDIEKQPDYVRKEFDKKLYKIISQLTVYGFDSDLFFRISKFEKQISLVPCSAKTKEGLPELLAMLAGLSQKFLSNKLKLSQEAKGTILEIKKEKITYCEAILYDGTLKKTDILVIATLDKAIDTKIRALFKVQPLGKGYENVSEVSAAAGIRLQFPSETTEKLVPGMPFVVAKSKTEKEIQDLKQKIQKEISSSIEIDKEGIIAKADSLGSLEALLLLLKKAKFKIAKASIGNITQSDISLAKSFSDINQVIVGFNISSEVETEKEEQIKIITNDVIYHIIEQLQIWNKAKYLEIERKKLQGITWPVKIKLLRNCCFRQSKPAIFGIKVESGILKSGTPLINSENEEIDKVKVIQAESKSLDKATQGQEVAISLPNVTYGRQIKEDDILYSSLNEQEFLRLKENKKYLNSDELSLLQEIAEIKRKGKATWGI
jgi:translation initiation factor 5B